VSEFDTVDDLRADIRKRLELVNTVQAQVAARERVLDAAADLVTIDLSDALVQREMEQRLHDIAHRLEAQGATIQQYLQATGMDEQAFVQQVRETAERGVRADLALRSVAAQEGIVATDEELDEEVARLAERLEEKPKKVRRDLERRGILEAVRSDIAKGKTVRYLVDHAEVVDEAGNPLDLKVPEGEPSPTREELEQGPGDDAVSESSEEQSEEPQA
jgi:trigger factor